MENVAKDTRANMQMILLFLFYFSGGAIIGSNGLYE